MSQFDLGNADTATGRTPIPRHEAGENHPGVRGGCFLYPSGSAHLPVEAGSEHGAAARVSRPGPATASTGSPPPRATYSGFGLADLRTTPVRRSPQVFVFIRDQFCGTDPSLERGDLCCPDKPSSETHRSTQQSAKPAFDVQGFIWGIAPRFRTNLGAVVTRILRSWGTMRISKHRPRCSSRTGIAIPRMRPPRSRSAWATQLRRARATAFISQSTPSDLRRERTSSVRGQPLGVTDSVRTKAHGSTKPGQLQIGFHSRSG